MRWKREGAESLPYYIIYSIRKMTLAKKDGTPPSFLLFHFNGAVFFFKVPDALFDHLLQFFVLGAAFVFCDISQLIQQFLLHPQGVAAQIIFRSANLTIIM